MYQTSHTCNRSRHILGTYFFTFTDVPLHCQICPPVTTTSVVLSYVVNKMNNFQTSSTLRIDSIFSYSLISWLKYLPLVMIVSDDMSNIIRKKGLQINIFFLHSIVMIVPVRRFHQASTESCCSYNRGLDIFLPRWLLLLNLIHT